MATCGPGKQTINAEEKGERPASIPDMQAQTMASTSSDDAETRAPFESFLLSISMLFVFCILFKTDYIRTTISHHLSGWLYRFAIAFPNLLAQMTFITYNFLKTGDTSPGGWRSIVTFPVLSFIGSLSVG